MIAAGARLTRFHWQVVKRFEWLMEDVASSGDIDALQPKLRAWMPFWVNFSREQRLW